MSKFQVLAGSEIISSGNGYIYRVQKGFLIPEERGKEKIRIAYWKHRGKRGFGQNAPILPEHELGMLIRKSIAEGILGQDFLKELWICCPIPLLLARLGSRLVVGRMPLEHEG